MLGQRGVRRVEALDDLLGGRVGDQAGDRQRQLRRALAVDRRRCRRPARPGARTHARHRLVVDADDDDVVRVVRDGAGERAALQAEAVRRSRGRRGRSRGGARSPRSSPGRAPGRRRPRRRRTSGRPRARTSAAGRGPSRSRARGRRRAGTRRSSGATGAMFTVVRSQPGTGDAAPDGRRSHDLAVLDHERRLEALEVLEQHEVGAVAGRDRAAVGQAVAERAGAATPCTSASSAAMPSRDGDAAHLVEVALAQQHVGLAVVGAERAALGPVAAHQLEQRRAGCARWRPRGSAPRRRARRFSSASSTSSPRGRCGCRPPGRRRAARRARRARGRRRCRRRERELRQLASSPAITAGKFIISAIPITPGVREQLAHLVGPERAARGTRAGSPARTRAPSRTRRAARRAHASRSHSTPARAEHVGELVRVGHDGRRPAREQQRARTPRPRASTTRRARARR